MTVNGLKGCRDRGLAVSSGQLDFVCTNGALIYCYLYLKSRICNVHLVLVFLCLALPHPAFPLDCLCCKPKYRRKEWPAIRRPFFPKINSHRVQLDLSQALRVKYNPAGWVLFTCKNPWQTLYLWQTRKQNSRERLHRMYNNNNNNNNVFI